MNKIIFLNSFRWRCLCSFAHDNRGTFQMSNESIWNPITILDQNKTLNDQHVKDALGKRRIIELCALIDQDINQSPNIGKTLACWRSQSIIALTADTLDTNDLSFTTMLDSSY